MQVISDHCVRVKLFVCVYKLTYEHIQVKPPERGVFALDHDGECKSFMEKYLRCLREKQNLHFDCRELSKLYLNCRMDNGLMAEENMSSLVNDKNELYIHSIALLLSTRVRLCVYTGSW